MLFRSKKYGPTTPGRRGMTVTDYSVLTKVAPERSLLEPMKKHSGRNNTGRITVRHQGGGNRTKYRVIDFKRQKTDMPATVKTLEYDPNRSAFIALVEYTDGTKSSYWDSVLHVQDRWETKKDGRQSVRSRCWDTTPVVLGFYFLPAYTTEQEYFWKPESIRFQNQEQWTDDFPALPVQRP